MATLVLFCYRMHNHHWPAPNSLSSQQRQAPLHTATEASVYQVVVPIKHTDLKSTKLDIDISLLENTAYGHMTHTREVSTKKPNLNANSDCAVVNPVYC